MKSRFQNGDLRLGLGLGRLPALPRLGHGLERLFAVGALGGRAAVAAAGGSSLKSLTAMGVLLRLSQYRTRVAINSRAAAVLGSKSHGERNLAMSHPSSPLAARSARRPARGRASAVLAQTPPPAPRGRNTAAARGPGAARAAAGRHTGAARRRSAPPSRSARAREDARRRRQGQRPGDQEGRAARPGQGGARHGGRRAQRRLRAPSARHPDRPHPAAPGGAGAGRDGHRRGGQEGDGLACAGSSPPPRPSPRRWRPRG